MDFEALKSLEERIGSARLRIVRGFSCCKSSSASGISIEAIFDWLCGVICSCNGRVDGRVYDSVYGTRRFLPRIDVTFRRLLLKDGDHKPS